MPSENGWNPARAQSSECEWVRIPGAEHVSLQFLKGHPLTILRAFAADYHTYVEPLRDADSAAWTPTNSVSTSNHLNGTAMDLNWNGADGKTFRLGISKERAYPGDRARNLDELLEFYEDFVYCGGYWSIQDWMHFQMGYGSWNNPATQDFIRRKIRPDGYSTFRRGAGGDQPILVGLTAETLSEAMGGSVSLTRYQELLPAVKECLRLCNCESLNRIAMWMAQIGHESAGLRYMEEIASGAAYEGRAELGNIYAGDGVRFKGRGPIQVTGRYNYTKLSEWAHSRGLVPTPTFFVDNPEQLASDKYGFLGVVWYWTVARPAINAMADKDDIVGVTKAINGGTNGLADRKARWMRAKAMGLEALDPGTTPPGEDEGFMSALSPEEQRALYNEVMAMRKSRSPLRHVGSEWAGDMGDITWNTDGSVHVLVTYLSAVILGDPDAIALLREVAGVNTVQYPDRLHDSRLAQAMLNLIDGKFTTASAPRTGETTGAALAAPVAIPAPPPPAPAPQVYTPTPVAPRQAAQQQALGQAPQGAEGGLLGELLALTTKLQNVSRQVTDITEGESK